MNRLHHSHNRFHLNPRTTDPDPQPLANDFEAVNDSPILQYAASLTKRGSSSSSSSSSSAGSATSCPANDDSGACEKPVGSQETTLPIVLGVVIPVVVALVVFIILHRRHVNKLRREDATDKHKSLDFGMDDAGIPNGKKGKKGKGRPEMTVSEMETQNNIRRGRGMSMDMGSPFLLPPGLQGSRESLHSLSRTIHAGDDRYRPATTYLGNDTASQTSYPSSLRRGRDDSSINTGSSGDRQDLIRNAQRMSRSTPPNGTLPGNTIPELRFPEPAYSMSRKVLPSNPKDEDLAPIAAVDEPRDSYIDRDGGNMLKSNSYLREIIHSRDPSADLVKQASSPLPQERPQANAVSNTQDPHQIGQRKTPPPTANTLPSNARPPRLQSMEAQIQTTSHEDFLDDESDYGDVFKVTPPSPDRGSNLQRAPSTRHSVDLSMPSGEDSNDVGLGLEAPELGYDVRRLSMGFRPLPPDDPSDNPEQRANRIRSFYKEYFDESKPGPIREGNAYYEDYGQEYLGGGAAVFDPASGDFVVAQAPFAAPVTRRAMTPPPRAPPRFQGPPRHTSTMSGGRDMSPGPRAFSSQSRQFGPRGPDSRGPASRRPMPPPAPLNVLPTPHLLQENAFALGIDFAPPSTYRERAAGRPESPRGGARPYTPSLRAHVPLVSSFDDLSVMPSPHLLRKSGTFTALDFAPPPRFKNSENGSDAGSIRSNRSAMSANQLHNIRAGAYRLIKQLSATPTLLAQNDPSPIAEVLDPQTSLQANKATFFFRLERELEKVNAFYLQKEAELKLRLKTLLDKKKVMQSRNATTSKVSATFITLEEGFQQFGNDLNKLQVIGPFLTGQEEYTTDLLQQFVEINATAFSKILKKWDKTSKSRTKELYLSRAVEKEPCFNREIISDLSDQATTSLLELSAWAEGEKIQYDARTADHIVSGQSIGTDDNDTDSQFLQAVDSGNVRVLEEWITRLGNSLEARDRCTRTFLSAISEAPEDTLKVLQATVLVDIHAEDEINERNCLHEAAISGRAFVLETGLSRGVDVSRVDVYGRIPLHYACMHGRVEMVQRLLDAGPATVDLMDHDNFTPLIHGIVHHQLPCVQRLLSNHARIDPASESDHAPLNLACQHGSSAIVELLLQRKAQFLPDAEGLYPQHLVARSGQAPQILLMLRDYGADLNQLDKLYQWTPLFHAASEGHVQCLRTLLESGVSADILDEKDLSAMYYATWEGHLECMALLRPIGSGSGLVRPPALITQQSVTNPISSVPEPMSMDADGIPDLSLPPPIIPLRRYGHNFLDTKTFVQISFEEAGSDAIVFYHDSKYPAARLTISSKLSDLIPRNLLLPIQEDTKIISFQIDNLDSFAIDFDIFPTFGSKVIAKSVALSSVFRALTSSSGHACLPLFDPRLRAIGQISFNFQVIKPFPGIPLEITHFATYWKATSQFESSPNALITGSSLSGEYVRLFVQLTSDGIPVLFPRWTVTHGGIDLAIGRLTFKQFQTIGTQKVGIAEVLKNLQTLGPSNVDAIHSLLAASFVSLHDALAYLSPDVHVDMHILYPPPGEEHGLRLGPTANLNDFADAILTEVFDHARVARERSPDFVRSILFSSYNPDACTALNWKQPNYPVFLCNELGRQSMEAKEDIVESSGRKSLSVKEAVRIAQDNNFMGVICCSRLLDMVPALIESIKVAGLVLVTDTTGTSSDNKDTTATTAASYFYGLSEGIDGALRGNGVLGFTETIDV
ncbi:MAG: phosphate system positive regulatory protein pho81 [Pycnora praestabilis]|nr:MAG: phosphate system positive regulatory protein pho81 [Pycnora praestabilis]